MTDPRSIYYAHPMSWYGTDHEKADLQEIRLEWPGIEIINPSDPKHVEAAQAIYARGGTSAEVMVYFEDLVAGAEALVYRSFSDGKLGAGVSKEILTAHVNNRPIFRLYSGCTAAICGQPHIISGSEADLLWGTLTIEKTRERIKRGVL